MISLPPRNTLRACATFDEQLQRSFVADNRIDAYLRARRCHVEPVSLCLQLAGMDRIVTTPTGRVWRVEYKADWVAGATDNAYIETVANDVTSKSGWAYTAQSDLLVYYVPPREIAYVVTFSRLRAELPRWRQTFPLGYGRNEHYRTVGRLVPLRELSAVAVQLITVAQSLPVAA